MITEYRYVRTYLKIHLCSFCKLRVIYPKKIVLLVDVNECIQIEQRYCVHHNGNTCLDIVQKCHNCVDLDPGFECACNEGFHLWEGNTQETIKSREGENGQEIWHILAENVSCVRKSPLLLNTIGQYSFTIHRSKSNKNAFKSNANHLRKSTSASK